MAAIAWSSVVIAGGCGFPVAAAKYKLSLSSPSPHPRLPFLRSPSATVCSSAAKSDAKVASHHAPTSALASAAALLTAAAAATTSYPALALVDERLSGEGTGLSLGLSNPLLLWILLGVSALIWSLYFNFTSSLPEGDDDTGLSL